MRNFFKKSIVIVLLLICFNVFMSINTNAAGTKTTIMIDLDKGNISLNTSCSGWVTNYAELSEDIKAEFTANSNGSYSWTHNSAYSYYIYQSSNGLENKNIFKETLASVDFTDVVAFGEKWDEIATSKGFKAANGTAAHNARYKIAIGGAINIEVILHNIWSTYYAEVQTVGSIDVKGSSNSSYTLKLRGDNRINRLGYYNSNDSTKLVICDDPDDDYIGTLTVVGDQTPFETCGIDSKKYPANHWDSAIGGSDSSDRSYNINIESGCVYAGTTAAENCTAIGGGGNGLGKVNISGGTVYAISSSTGTAIGGGIGHQSYGGNCLVNISGGNVYAYNFGQPFKTTHSDNKAKGIPDFVPGTAIGGGSSISSSGNQGEAEINISGGVVEAYSVAGSAIGGGNSINQYGGKGKVNITGGQVTATSVESTVYNMPRGTGIGGGSSTGRNSGARDGGTATVNITGGQVIATGIGGGTSKYGDGGSATVTVDGGTLDSISIGGGFSEANGYAYGNVTVNGGSMNSEVSTIVEGVDSKDVFLTRVCIYKDDVIQANIKIDNLEIEGITGSYILNDIYTDEEGYIYIWIPAGSAIISGKIEGSEYLPLEEVDGKINVTDLGILKYETPKEHCTVNIINSMYYTPSLTDDVSGVINGNIIIEKNILFQYYLIADSDEYVITPYHAVTTSSGKIYQMGSALTKVSGKDNVYVSSQMTIASDTQIIFNIRDGLGNSYYTLDLTNGHINVSEGENNTIVVEQNGYILNISKDDKLYITSAGYPTDNTIKFNLAMGTELDVYMDKVNVSSDDSVINIEQGTVNLEFSASDNMITSSGGSAIMIGENGRLNISSSEAEKNSIKVESASGYAAISGQGTLSILDDGGYLKFNKLSENTGVSQISVGTYIYKGSKQPSYTANIYGGEFTFDVIGYLDKEGNLKSKTELGNDNINDFTARGLFRVFTDVESVSEVITDGNFIMMIQTATNSTIGDVTLNAGSTLLVEGIDYVITENANTKTIKIYGSAFQKGNITVMAAGYGKIAYTSVNYEGVYDGESHNIVLIYNETSFIAYYSYSELTIENYTTGETNKAVFNEIDFTHGAKTIYWYIVPKDLSAHYTHASGSNTINILQATNKWNKELSCPDIALNYTINPQAEAKFGDHEYSIYKLVGGSYVEATLNVDYKMESNKYKFIKEGTYYIKAVVSETYNYTGLDSGYIRFNVVKIAVFTDVVRNLASVNGSEAVIGVTSNGAFSVRYEFLSVADMEFIFTTTTGVPIPKGTKFTLIVFDDASTKYYYYNYDPVAEQETSFSIELVEFQLMGTKNNTNMFAEPNIGSSSNYQITVDFPDNLSATDNKYSSELTVKFSAVDTNVVVKRDSNTEANFNSDLVIKTVEDSLTVETNITSNPGAGNTILSFSVYKDGAPCDLDLSNIVLSSGVNNYNPKVYGNVIIFNIGKSTLSNVTYRLLLDNLDKGEYVIESDVRVIFSDDVQYSLGYKNANNHKTANIDVVGDLYAAIRIDYVSNTGTVLVVSKEGQEIQVEVTLSDKNYNEVTKYEGISVLVEVYEKTPNGYIKVELPSEIAFVLTSNSIIFKNPVPVTTDAKIFQLRVTIDYETACHNYIISNE